jgi:serine/threonine-protein kinase
MELLLKVTSEEPRPPRALDRSIPPDLDAIVMRCLRKDPGERYASAADLEEDLDAYLERRRVRAYRGGLLYATRTLLRRSPVATAAALLLLAATAVATGMWVRSDWQSARQAAAAQSFGAQVAGLESLLWKERSLPAHDIRSALQQVRRRMREIESEIERRGEVSRAPGHLALGNVHLALGEPDAALPHLELAWAEGYSPRETAWALGSALAAIYQRGLESLETLADEELRAAERDRLDREHGDRARQLLRAARGCTAASPTYVESVLALVEGRTGDGLRLARKSFSEAP